MSASDRIADVADKLDALLRIRYAAVDQSALRSALVARYLVNELSRWLPNLKPAMSIDEILACAANLSPGDVAVVRRRCLFYGCDDLIGLLVNKRIKGDAIAREEAVLYVQDRLQRDDFRRIDSFQADRGASFVTYMWQVVNNLLLDYLRAHGKRAQRQQKDLSNEVELRADEDDRLQSSAEGHVEIMQLRALLAETMNECAMGASSHPLRERLREHLRLSSQERVLLKAMFQYDMSIAEICALPGFELSAGEAYRSYYRVMDKLMDAFKQAGLTESLRSLVSNAAPRVSVLVDGEECQVAANRIHYLAQDDRRTACHLQWRGETHGGSIAESFAKIFKRLAAFFSAIDSTTAVSDNLLAATHRQWRESGEIAIAGVERRFRIGLRYLSELKSRFAREGAEKRVESLV